MTIFKRLSEGLWSFVSPRRTQQRREKPFKVPAKPRPNKAGEPSHLEVPEAGPSDAMETVEDNHEFPLTPTSTRLSAGIAEFEESTPRSPDFNATENTKVERDPDAEAKGEYVLDVAAHQAKVRSETKRLRDMGWSEEVIEVYYKISMRGYEPLLPREWEKDFPGYPKGLFIEREKAYIVPVGSSDFRAAHAFKKLSQLGPDFRDSIATQIPGTPSRRRPQEKVRHAVEAYFHWACTDGKFDVSKHGQDLPLLAFDANPSGVSIDAMEVRIQKKLEALAERWTSLLRVPGSGEATTTQPAEVSFDNASVVPPTEIDKSQYIMPPPTLYGIVTSGATCALVFYNIQRPGPVLPCAIFNFTQRTHDFWNAMAIAIFVIHVRDIMWDLRNDLKEAGLYKEPVENDS